MFLLEGIIVHILPQHEKQMWEGTCASCFIEHFISACVSAWELLLKVGYSQGRVSPDVLAHLSDKQLSK